LKYTVIHYLETSRLGPLTTVQTIDSGLRNMTSTDEVGIYISLPRHVVYKLSFLKVIKKKKKKKKEKTFYHGT